MDGYLEKEYSRQRECQCKGPGMRGCLVQLNSSEQASVAEAERGTKGDEVRQVMGQITKGCGKKDTGYNFVRNEKPLQGLMRQMTFLTYILKGSLWLLFEDLVIGTKDFIKS